MFSTFGQYPAVGLFSAHHIISLVACVFCIILAVVLTRKMKKETLINLFRIFSIVLTCFELFKISWNIHNGYVYVNSWVPLYFCSLFIYALWFSWAKNEKVREIGYSFIALAGVFAGAVFLIVPSTSFSLYPIYHFLCLYSMLYHSIMIYSGIMIFVTKLAKPNFKFVVKYCMFTFVSMMLALTINIFFKGNLMFVASPAGVPLPFLWSIYKYSQTIYSGGVIVAHMLLGFVVWGVYELIQKLKRKSVKR